MAIGNPQKANSTQSMGNSLLVGRSEEKLHLVSHFLVAIWMVLTMLHEDGVVVPVLRRRNKGGRSEERVRE